MEKIRSQGFTTETDAEIGQMQRSISFGIMGGNISHSQRRNSGAWDTIAKKLNNVKHA